MPVLENYSAPKAMNSDDASFDGVGGFYLGYSPERINPGDPTHRLDNIVKITSGYWPSQQDRRPYKRIIPVGTYPVSSIKVAEAAKVIENTQRDINIAFVNELSHIFRIRSRYSRDFGRGRLEVEFSFLPSRFCRGHCIGVIVLFNPSSKMAGYDPGDNSFRKKNQ